jgi:hypothetical protein
VLPGHEILPELREISILSAQMFMYLGFPVPCFHLRIHSLKHVLPLMLFFCHIKQLKQNQNEGRGHMGGRGARKSPPGRCRDRSKGCGSLGLKSGSPVGFSRAPREFLISQFAASTRNMIRAGWRRFPRVGVGGLRSSPTAKSGIPQCVFRASFSTSPNADSLLSASSSVYVEQMYDAWKVNPTRYVEYHTRFSLFV